MDDMVEKVEQWLADNPPAPRLGVPDFAEGGALNAGRCEGCGHHIIVGHVVTLYADVGEVHLDCDKPYHLPTVEAAGTEGDPKVYVLLGYPVMNYPAPLDHSSHVRNMVSDEEHSNGK